MSMRCKLEPQPTPMMLLQLRQKGEALAAAEASLRGQQEYAAGLQDTVRLEQERIATFTGRNTDRCTTAELNVLACVHEDALTRVRSQLVGPGPGCTPILPHSYCYAHMTGYRTAWTNWYLWCTTMLQASCSTLVCSRVTLPAYVQYGFL